MHHHIHIATILALIGIIVAVMSSPRLREDLALMQSVFNKALTQLEQKLHSYAGDQNP